MFTFPYQLLLIHFAFFRYLFTSVVQLCWPCRINKAFPLPGMEFPQSAFGLLTPVNIWDSICLRSHRHCFCQLFFFIIILDIATTFEFSLFFCCHSIFVNISWVFKSSYVAKLVSPVNVVLLILRTSSEYESLPSFIFCKTHLESAHTNYSVDIIFNPISFNFKFHVAMRKIEVSIFRRFIYL